MLNQANEVAREVGTEAQIAEIADMTGQSMADISSHLRDAHLDAHAQQWSGTVLRNADFTPIAQTEQAVITADGEGTTTSTVNLGVNGQAARNAADAMQVYQAMGFSPEASAKAAQLVTTYTTAAQGNSQTSFAAASPEAQEPMALGQEQGMVEPLSTEQPISIEQQEALAQPVAQADELELQDTMAELSEAVDQDESIPQDVRVRTALDEELTLEDPLADTEYMREVDVEELPEAVAQQTGLTEETEQPLQIADSSRLDWGTEIAEQTAELETQATGTESETRFDLKLTESVEADVAPESRLDLEAPIAIGSQTEETQAIEQQVSGLETEERTFKLSSASETNTTRREGRARIGVYSLAA